MRIKKKFVIDVNRLLLTYIIHGAVYGGFLYIANDYYGFFSGLPKRIGGWLMVAIFVIGAYFAFARPFINYFRAYRASGIYMIELDNEFLFIRSKEHDERVIKLSDIYDLRLISARFSFTTSIMSLFGLKFLDLVINNSTIIDGVIFNTSSLMRKIKDRKELLLFLFCMFFSSTVCFASKPKLEIAINKVVLNNDSLILTPPFVYVTKKNQDKIIPIATLDGIDVGLKCRIIKGKMDGKNHYAVELILFQRQAEGWTPILKKNHSHVYLNNKSICTDEAFLLEQDHVYLEYSFVLLN